MKLAYSCTRLGSRHITLSFPPGAPEIELMKVKFQQLQDNWIPREEAVQVNCHSLFLIWRQT